MMKKVLVYGMTDNPGGIETYLINTMEELKTQNIRLDFVCDFPSISYSEKIKDNGSCVYFIPAKSKGVIRHWVELMKILKQHKEYSVVYFNILDAGAAFTMFIPWLLRRKIVTHSHNGETDKKILHKCCRPIMNVMTSQYLACSKKAAWFMFGKSENIQNKVVLIPNAINVEKYQYSETVRQKKRAEFQIDESSMVVCFVGRLSMQKNPFGMLDIFGQLLKDRMDAILLVIGTGELETEVKQYALKLGIQNNVKFLGCRFDIAECLQAADVFFLPSFYEGLPIVALEAQAAGLYCILSKNITDETDITGNVRFVEIDAPVGKWVDLLIKYASFPRDDVKEILEKSEFNIKNFSKVINKLKKCL